MTGWGACHKDTWDGKWALPARDGTDLLNFLDVTVLVIGGDNLGGLDAFFVLEQGCNLQQNHRSVVGRGH